MGVLRHAFQMISFSRSRSVTKEIPKEGEVHINVTMQNPPTFLKFKQKDVALVLETVNIRMKDLAEVIMRGETLYEFQNALEKEECKKHVEKEKKLPDKIEKIIMNHVGAKAILLLVKAQSEIGIPPPVPLPLFAQ